MVTFDEHGGTYDHIPPPPAAPPDPTAPAGQFGFTFNRSGTHLAIRLDPERTVVTQEYRATSVPLDPARAVEPRGTIQRTRRHRPSLRPIFTLDQPRHQEDWPEVLARPVDR